MMPENLGDIFNRRRGGGTTTFDPNDPFGGGPVGADSASGGGNPGGGNPFQPGAIFVNFHTGEAVQFQTATNAQHGFRGMFVNAQGQEVPFQGAWMDEAGNKVFQLDSRGSLVGDTRTPTESERNALLGGGGPGGGGADHYYENQAADEAARQQAHQWSTEEAQQQHDWTVEANAEAERQQAIRDKLSNAMSLYQQAVSLEKAASAQGIDVRQAAIGEMGRSPWRGALMGQGLTAIGTDPHQALQNDLFSYANRLSGYGNTAIAPPNEGNAGASIPGYLDALRNYPTAPQGGATFGMALGAEAPFKPKPITLDKPAPPAPVALQPAHVMAPQNFAAPTLAAYRSYRQTPTLGIGALGAKPIGTLGATPQARTAAGDLLIGGRPQWLSHNDWQTWDRYIASGGNPHTGMSVFNRWAQLNPAPVASHETPPSDYPGGVPPGFVLDANGNLVPTTPSATGRPPPPEGFKYVNGVLVPTMPPGGQVDHTGPRPVEPPSTPGNASPMPPASTGGGQGPGGPGHSIPPNPARRVYPPAGMSNEQAFRWVVQQRGHDADWFARIVPGEGVTWEASANWDHLDPTDTNPNARSYGPIQLNTDGLLPLFREWGYTNPNDIVQAANFLMDYYDYNGTTEPWHGAPHDSNPRYATGGDPAQGQHGGVGWAALVGEGLNGEGLANKTAEVLHFNADGQLEEVIPLRDKAAMGMRALRGTSYAPRIAQPSVTTMSRPAGMSALSAVQQTSADTAPAPANAPDCGVGKTAVWVGDHWECRTPWQNLGDPSAMVQPLGKLWQAAGFQSGQVPLSSRIPGYGNMLESPALPVFGQDPYTALQPNQAQSGETFHTLGTIPKLIWDPNNGQFYWNTPEGVYHIGGPDEFQRRGFNSHDVISMPLSELIQSGAGFVHAPGSNDYAVPLLTDADYGRLINQSPQNPMETAPLFAPLNVGTGSNTGLGDQGVWLPDPRMIVSTWDHADPDSKALWKDAYGAAGLSDAAFLRYIEVYAMRGTAQQGGAGRWG